MLPPTASASSAKNTAMHGTTAYHNQRLQKPHLNISCSDVPQASFRPAAAASSAENTATRCAAGRPAPASATTADSTPGTARRTSVASLAGHLRGTQGLQTLLVAVHGLGTGGLAQPTAHLAPLHTSACVEQNKHMF